MWEMTAILLYYGILTYSNPSTSTTTWRGNSSSSSFPAFEFVIFSPLLESLFRNEEGEEATTCKPPSFILSPSQIASSFFKKNCSSTYSKNPQKIQRKKGKEKEASLLICRLTDSHLSNRSAVVILHYTILYIQAILCLTIPFTYGLYLFRQINNFYSVHKSLKKKVSVIAQ